MLNLMRDSAEGPTVSEMPLLPSIVSSIACICSCQSQDHFLNLKTVNKYNISIPDRKKRERQK